MEIVIFWLFLSFVAAIIASNKGRSGFGFFMLSVVLSPLIGIIAALIADKNEELVEEKAISSGKEKKCPYCAELVKAEANVCRFCGRDLPKESIPPKVDKNIIINIEGYRTVGDLIEYAHKPGYSKAKYLLGMLYIEGDKIEKNVAEGTKFISMAADEGYEEAINRLRMLTNESA